MLAPEPPPRLPAPEPLEIDPAASPAVVASLRAELETRARDDAELRARLIDAESRLSARMVLEHRTTATLGELRAELHSLADALTRERLLRTGAERRAGELERELHAQRALSLSAYVAIGELRETLAGLAEPEPEPEAVGEPEPAPAPPAAPEPGSETDLPARLVEPARLSDALSRLRETIAPQEAPGQPSAPVATRPPSIHEAPGPPPAPVATRPPSIHEALARPSVERAFRTMARTDPDAAGRLLLELLPLQRVVYPHAVSYDLVLGPDRCVWVSVPDGAPIIEVKPAPRPRQEVDFQVVGDPRKIARLLTAGWLGRRFGRAARVRGRRQGVVALSALLGAPLDLGALHRAGVSPDPLIAFSLVAAMIDPAWTATERFTLAHAAPDASRTYLVARDGRPLGATRIAPEDGATTTLSCTTEHLLAALAGEPVPGVRVTGDVAAWLSLRKWIKRAQSE
jgi:hypothetical protein